MLKFPENFYWGTATSAYQVEGGIKNDWSMIGKKFDAGIACDHYHKFEEDFDLAKSLNNNAHRFSIEWARIEPEEGKFDQKEIEHYRKVILALKERGLEPFMTLYHWTLPIWFVEKGGWLNEDAPKDFGRFVGKIVSEYKDLVKFWITLNEPDNVYAVLSFLIGKWPPFIKNWFKFRRVCKQLIITHKEIYELIHKISPDAFVGIAQNYTHFKGFLKILNTFWNQKFLNKIENHHDFIGLNYYFHHSLSEILKLSHRKRTDIGWEIYPEGIYHVLKDFKKYNKPIYITENGLADAKDEKRTKFIIEHLKWVYKAIEEGVDVRGYFHWSLLDNFEWDKGFEPRFGLIEIDYKTFQRIPRPSSRVYAEICKNNGTNL
ncbi:MAG TPA: glycoside hydrolase family 1 protein [Candidatus Paceibacterota bacterium]|nr:glycoside hydrolase family 1 protein [Candidatus Paceibacterota bacterium]